MQAKLKVVTVEQTWKVAAFFNADVKGLQETKKGKFIRGADGQTSLSIVEFIGFFIDISLNMDLEGTAEAVDLATENVGQA